MALNATDVKAGRDLLCRLIELGRSDQQIEQALKSYARGVEQLKEAAAKPAEAKK
ncbi:hypothetical protein [Paraburkholderia strydomiana]|uniref:Uncharacterized protein n=1 Tax=Paraburkholderia strydomiana TaxID=1245417 RepID=A0ABW9C2K9_9BURK